MEEFVRKIPQKSYLSKRIKQQELSIFSQLIHQVTEIVPIIKDPIPAVVRDPKDDYLLAYAMVAAADYLVTGDNDLLVLKQIGDMKIISPPELSSKLKID